MGNELKSQSSFDIKTEQHTIDEEAPLNLLKLNDDNTSNETNESQQQSPKQSKSPSLPYGWEKRIDPNTNKPYYMNHNDKTTQWNPPNTITKVNDKWVSTNRQNDKASIIIHNETNKINQLSDCWDISDPKQNPFIQFDEQLPNTIYLKRKKPQWISCFGTKIVTKGEYKRWQIKILPNDPDNNNNTNNNNENTARSSISSSSSSSSSSSHSRSNSESLSPKASTIKNALTKIKKDKSKKSKSKAKTAKVVIGIIDVDSINDREQGQCIDSEFWLLPYFGYGYGGDKGKKYHIDKKGKSYSKKYKIGDLITIEVNRTSNQYLTHNDLKFYTNEKVDGLAFNIDNDRNYVLAVALNDDKYKLQISD